MYYEKEDANPSRRPFSLRKLIKKKKRPADITIKCRGSKIECHSKTLMGNSDMLKGMLQTDMKERNQKVIRLDYLEPEVIKKIVDYMYCGKISGNPLSLIHAADYLGMLELRDICMKHCIDNVSLSDSIVAVVPYMHAAMLFQSDELAKKCVNIMVYEMDKIARTEPFLNLDLNHLIWLLSVASDNYCSDNDLLFAVLLWINEKPARISHLPEIKEKVGINNFSKSGVDRSMSQCQNVGKKIFEQLIEESKNKPSTTKALNLRRRRKLCLVNHREIMVQVDDEDDEEASSESSLHDDSNESTDEEFEDFYETADEEDVSNDQQGNSDESEYESASEDISDVDSTDDSDYNLPPLTFGRQKPLFEKLCSVSPKATSLCICQSPQGAMFVGNLGCYVFNANIQTVTNFAMLPDEYSEVSCVFANNRLHVLVEREQDKKQRVIYLDSDGRWQNTPICSALEKCSETTNLNDDIYALGERKLFQLVKDARLWNVIYIPESCHQQSSLISVDNEKLMVINATHIECYIPASRAWENIANDLNLDFDAL